MPVYYYYDYGIVCLVQCLEQGYTLFGHSPVAN